MFIAVLTSPSILGLSMDVSFWMIYGSRFWEKEAGGWVFIREKGGWERPGEKDGHEDAVYLPVFISDWYLCVYIMWCLFIFYINVYVQHRICTHSTVLYISISKHLELG